MKSSVPVSEFLFSKSDLPLNSKELFEQYHENPAVYAETALSVMPQSKDLRKGVLPYFVSAVAAIGLFVFLTIWLEDAKGVSDGLVKIIVAGIFAYWAAIFWAIWQGIKGIVAFGKKKKLMRKFFDDFGSTAKQSPDWQGFGKHWFESRDSYYFKGWRTYLREKEEYRNSSEKENAKVRAKGNRLGGKKEGIWELFDEDGKYLKDEFYENGEMLWSSKP